jgi:hypothetical protein
MKIRVPRPEDPELARLWDEAKRAVEERSDPDCCVGDRSRCRCQPQGGWSSEDETGGEG